MRCVCAGFVGVVVLLAGCGGDDGPTSASTGESSATPTSAASATSRLDGTWRTERITTDDMVRTLREHGLGKWTARFRRNSPIAEAPTALILELREGRWDLYGLPQGGPREEIDYDAGFDVTGDTVRVTHERDSNVYRWSVTGKDLRLAWQRTTYPPSQGIPEEVYQRALYMTADFRRAD